MKNITGLLILTLIGFNISAQVRQSYYMVGVDETGLIPTVKTLKEDGTYTLQFADNSLQNYFTNTTVYEYKQAFPTATTPYLRKVCKITLDNDMALGDLLNLNGVVFAELLDEKIIYTHTPTDYLSYNGSPLEQLELIKAKKHGISQRVIQVY